ncbi:hypothetical protein [Streptomyces sp. NPDC046942]|uniref:hypothetical protein n=1 Tax=Streptomyces sp. NPDC046942 TaxID=3155137 RepID=UPI0033D55387
MRGSTPHIEPQAVSDVLRREAASTIGLLTDEEDFTAMRQYRTFAFDNHTAYLQQVEDLLKTRAAQGGHTTVALFDPEEYAEFCAHGDLEPDAASSRSRFTAELAATGPAVLYEGQPLAELIPELMDRAVRQATWEYASAALAQLGACASCSEDIGRSAFAYASRVLTGILDTASAGRRHLVCSVSAAPEPLVVVLHADEEPDDRTAVDEADALEFATVLALAIATRSPGVLVMRTTTSGQDRVYGWRIRGGRLEPLTAGEVFDAYCTDAESGNLISPESGVDYCAPPDLGDGGLTPSHTH